MLHEQPEPQKLFDTSEKLVTLYNSSVRNDYRNNNYLSIFTLKIYENFGGGGGAINPLGWGCISKQDPKNLTSNKVSSKQFSKFSVENFRW